MGKERDSHCRRLHSRPQRLYRVRLPDDEDLRGRKGAVRASAWRRLSPGWHPPAAMTTPAPLTAIRNGGGGGGAMDVAWLALLAFGMALGTVSRIRDAQKDAPDGGSV